MFLRLGPGTAACTTSPYHRVAGPQQAAHQETAPDENIPYAARSDPQDQLTDTGDEPEASTEGGKSGAHLRLPPGRLGGHDGVSSSRPKPGYSATGHTRGRAQCPDPERRSPDQTHGIRSSVEVNAPGLRRRHDTPDNDRATGALPVQVRVGPGSGGDRPVAGGSYGAVRL